MLRFSRNRVRVPDDLATVTQIDHAAEQPARSLGLDPRRVAEIWTRTENLYRSGLHPAITLVVRRHGEIILKRAIGTVSDHLALDGSAPVPLHPDSPICLFSASKAITALLVHKLVEQKMLGLDERVADYIPEFAAHGKHKVTVRDLLAHRAGIPSIPLKDPDPRLLLDWPQIVDLLCRARPFDTRFERQAYHALTGGFVIGELVRRVSGRELPALLRDWIAAPLGARHLTYGLAPELRGLAPRNAFIGPKLPVVHAYARRIVGAPFDRAVEISNDEAFLSSVVPAGNIYATADEASRVFQMLLNEGVLGGARLFDPDTVEEMVRPAGPMQVDGMLLVPLRFSAGFMLGENPFGLYGPSCPRAFGHLGFVSILCWADPARDISVALLNTGKTMAPQGVARLARLLGAIARACPPVKV